MRNSVAIGVCCGGGVHPGNVGRGFRGGGKGMARLGSVASFYAAKLFEDGCIHRSEPTVCIHLITAAALM